MELLAATVQNSGADERHLCEVHVEAEGLSAVWGTGSKRLARQEMVLHWASQRPKYTYVCALLDH